MNHPDKHHPEGHHHHGKSRPPIHKDWRAWVAVVLILTAMGVYIITNGEVLRFGPPPQPAAPAAPTK